MTNTSQKKEPKASNSVIELCLKIATDAHRGQFDRSGDPVVLHPLAVGLMGKIPDEICAGFLHDVVEDTSYSFDDLLSLGVPENIVNALKLLTHNKDIPYLDYVRNIINSGNQLAIVTKLSDLSHNLERGKRMGYQHLVAKHSSALEEFKKAGLI